MSAVSAPIWVGDWSKSIMSAWVVNAEVEGEVSQHQILRRLTSATGLLLGQGRQGLHPSLDGPSTAGLAHVLHHGHDQLVGHG